jgi:hypothetical protein
VIVYADRDRVASLADALAPSLLAAEGLRAAPEPAHAAAVDLLVELGELEAAVADAASPEEDTETDETLRLRRAMEETGRLVHATWRGDPSAALRFRDRACSAALSLAAAPLPARLRLRVPEGFAYYALLPECHLEAASLVARELRPRRAACIGLRSIGTSLSAVAAAALTDAGCETVSLTLRPRGHPFDRRLRLSPRLAGRLRELVRHGVLILVVDEGPGLSGSSLTGTARELSGLGARDDQVVLLPGHEPDPASFVSDEARRRWARHRRFVVPFERVWLESGRLARAFGASVLADLSGGRWRRLAYASESAYPAAHPAHERRKYLCLRARKEASGGPTLLKFEGLAGYGGAALERARRLARAGFGPAPARLEHGFLELEWLEGRRLSAADYGPRVRDTFAAYLSHRAASEGAPGPAPFDALASLLRSNAEEALGPGARAGIGALLAQEAVVRAGVAVAVDGRMLPHEWLEDRSGRLVKTDALDHHDDHWYPGRQDVAWDVAGAAVEFELDRAAEAALVAACARRLADPLLGARLPFYRAAYLAWRVGYCTLAASSLPGCPDRTRFETSARRYTAALREALVVAAAARTDVLPYG